jgi:hypothetical protein
MCFQRDEVILLFSYHFQYEFTDFFTFHFSGWGELGEGGGGGGHEAGEWLRRYGAWGYLWRRRTRRRGTRRVQGCTMRGGVTGLL